MVTDKVVSVVITGGTRGIDLGLASEFLRRGHGVMVSGRSQSGCDDVAGELRNAFAHSREEVMHRLDNSQAGESQAGVSKSI